MSRPMPPEARQRVQELLETAVALAERQSERGTELAYAIRDPLRRLANDVRAGVPDPPDWHLTAAFSHIGEAPGDRELSDTVLDAKELWSRFH